MEMELVPLNGGKLVEAVGRAAGVCRREEAA